MSQELDLLVTLAYSSLVGPEGHAAFVCALARTFRSHLVALQTDAPGHQHSALAHYNDLGRFLPEPESLTAGHAYVNPWFESPMVARLYHQGMADDRGCVEPAELRRSAFHADIMRPLDVFHSTGFLLEQGQLTSVLSVSRSQRAGYYTRQELDLAQALLPHLQNVHAIQKALARHGLPMEWAQQQPAWLLSASGQPCSRNAEAARTMAAANTSLVERDNRLWPTHPHDRQTLDALLTEVLAGRRLHGRLPLRDREGTPRWVAHVHFCRREAFLTWLLTDPPAALVCLRPMQADAADLPPMLMRLYGLTPAECRVAVKLLELDSPRQVAAALSRSEETVRSQLKAIYAKTGTHSQAQLFKLLAALNAG